MKPYWPGLALWALVIILWAVALVCDGAGGLYWLASGCTALCPLIIHSTKESPYRERP